MRYLTDHWSFDPFAVVVLILVVWHEIGLARLARRSRSDRTRQRRLRSVWFYVGLATLLISVESPIDYWSERYFFVHMIQHLLLMFAAPVLIVVGAPWQPLLDGLPGRLGREVTRQVMTGGWSRPLRAMGGFLLRPWVAVIAFNLTMVLWHLPGPFDLASRNQAVHIWLMHGSFVATGVLFWLQFLPSPPFLIRLPRFGQAVALGLTNLQMFILALSMSFFTATSWYSVYAHIPGVSFPPFADQQLGAAILWVCGDFWAVPAMIYVVRRMLTEEDDVSKAVDKILGRGSRRYQWASSRSASSRPASSGPRP